MPLCQERVRWHAQVIHEIDALCAHVQPCQRTFTLRAQVIHEIGDRYGLGVVPNFVGHGVGWHFHSAPVVTHVRNREPGAMVPGQTFTIEPMLTEGTTRSKARALSVPHAQCFFSGVFARRLTRTRSASLQAAALCQHGSHGCTAEASSRARAPLRRTRRASFRRLHLPARRSRLHC